MKFSQLLLLALFTLVVGPATLSAQQTLALVLRDANTEAPIEDAFVFFSGSSAGGITNAEGKVELQVEEYLELVISHLNYETKVLSVAEVQALVDPVILLTPVSVRQSTSCSAEIIGRALPQTKPLLCVIGPKPSDTFLTSRREAA